MKRIIYFILLLIPSFLFSQNTFDIGGTIITCGGNELPPDEIVQVNLIDENENIIQTTTGSPFLFEDVPAFEKYYIRAIGSQQNPLNGITTFDMVLISQHILGVNPFDFVCQHIAADTNNSGSTTTLDMVKLRRLILNVDQNLLSSVKVIPESVAFQDPTAPGGVPPVSTLIEIEELTEDELGVNFVRIKIGDLNN